MKRLVFAFSVAWVFGAAPALAAEPPATDLEIKGRISPGEVQATPEMWFYQQYHREYLDPKMAVRRNAEFRAAQRRRRVASLKWFGFSNQRPRASADPYHGDWSPSWVSNNGTYPFRWQGIGRSWVIAVPAGSAAQAY